MTTLQFLRIHRLTRCIHELRLLQQHLHRSIKSVSSPSPRFISFGRRLLVKGEDSLSFNRKDKLTEECGGVSVDESYLPKDVAQNDDVIGSKTSVSRLECEEKSDREDGSKTSVTSLKSEEKSDELIVGKTSVSSLKNDEKSDELIVSKTSVSSLKNDEKPDMEDGNQADEKLSDSRNCSNVILDTSSDVREKSLLDAYHAECLKDNINNAESLKEGLDNKDVEVPVNSNRKQSFIGRHVDTSLAENSDVAVETKSQTSDVNIEQTNVTMKTRLPSSELSTTEETKVTMETSSPTSEVTSEGSEVAMVTSLPTKEVTKEQTNVIMETSLPTSEVTTEESEVAMEIRPSNSEQTGVAMETRPPTSEESEVAMDTGPATIKKFEPTFTVAPLVYESKTLQKLVALGMDLSRLDKYDYTADSIVQLDFEKDVTPYLLFLKDLGVEDLGRYLSRNPLVFRQSLDDLNVRVRYLMSKKFDSDSVTRIVSRAPLFLSLPVTTVDRKLGFLQTSFHLTGNEVREVATKLPKIITWKLDKIKENRKYIQEFLGFTNIELKKMILIYPKIFLMDKHAVGKKFDFLHNTMGLDHKRLLEWPPVFGTRLHVIKSRHLYLLRVGRAQYNPGAENLVSLKRLCSGRDGEFCVDVARTSVKEYHEFLKCL